MIVRIKKKALRELFLGISVLAAFLLAIIGVSFNSDYVAGAINITNNSVMTRVNVTNTEPNITAVIVDDDVSSPASEIDLVANGVRNVYCNATIFDYNGWQDINSTGVNATLHIRSVGRDGATDNNHRYINESCGSCVNIGSSSTNASCSCRFAVQYYANDSNQWMCNITVSDLGGHAIPASKLYLADTEISSTVTITKLLAINTSGNSIIDYGNLSVTQTSSEIEYNITNGGNINVNMTVRGFGGSQNGENFPPTQNLTMICDFGNITDGYQRYYGATGTPYVDMKNLTNTTKGTNVTLFAKTEDNAVGFERNASYWRLQVPLGVGGICNGTVIFGAVDAEP